MHIHEHQDTDFSFQPQMPWDSNVLGAMQRHNIINHDIIWLKRVALASIRAIGPPWDEMPI